MSEVRIVARHPDGAEHDVTDAVQITYDALRHSLDWGSGFLDTAEIAAVVDLAERAGFEDFERLIVEIWAKRNRDEAWQRGKTTLHGFEGADLTPADITPAERAATLHAIKEGSL